MHFIHQRYSDNGNSSQGIVCEKQHPKPLFQCYTMEDEHRNIKMAGETRIPEGLYEVKYRKVLSPLTQKYRNKFQWFKWHLELQNVQGFSYVYLHIGNTEKNSDGCILISNTANNNQVARGFNGESTAAFEMLYGKIISELDYGNKVWWEVRNENQLL